jgi:hypothetical protein
VRLTWVLHYLSHGFRINSANERAWRGIAVT